ncbi:hypothetical protein [Wolbachia endosymbiont of Chironomus riparius]|uniref:hypothetical protein n=1 Tax=Wolbachia endosymbiont of Chironomus riparius TaxID=2883238 RepID=UPI00209F45B4|nr:hypothetical protein [Wolbachia endosymbiont of Chironomus riparius]
MKYTHKIGGVEEQKKILKQNNYRIFQEVVNSNNEQIISQILTLAMDRLTLDQQIKAVLETRAAFLMVELFKKNLKKEKNKEGNKYVTLIDKFFNAVESFYFNGKDNEQYRAFLIKTAISNYAIYLTAIYGSAEKSVVWNHLVSLSEYQNPMFKEHVDFMFNYINRIVPALNDNDNYIDIFQEFLNNSNKLSNSAYNIQEHILKIIINYYKDVQKTSAIELLEYINKLPEYRAQKILIASTVNSYKQDINNKIISESVSPSKRNLDSSDTNNSLSNKFSKTGDLICSKTSSRSKREISNCISWEEIDEFNEEKNEPRDVEKIKIDSEKFLIYLKNQNGEKRSRLIEIANKVGKEKIGGKFQSKINVLINNYRVISHLNKVGIISDMTMYGMMAKNVFGDFFNGDYEGVAINVGFIVGSQGFVKVAEAASLKGEALILNDKVMLGKSLKVASPFLARGTSAFIAYDLVNQIKEYKKGNKDAAVDISSDSIYIGVDVAEIGVEVAESFEILEGVSSVTGPIGAGIGAVVFIGTDIYKAIKRVASIDEVIHLKWDEKLIEGLRAFVGVKPELEIEELLEKKELYNKLVKQAINYLKQHNSIQRYVFPTSKSVVDSCRVVKYLEWCNVYRSGTIKPCRKKKEVCTTTLKEDLNNIVLLDEKRTDIKWDRTKPDNPSEGKLFCLPQGNYEQAPESGAYYCEKAIGIEYIKDRTGNYTLFNLGDGNDYVKGFKNYSNIFIIGDGDKNIFGSDEDDIFILQGSNIKGYIHGGRGTNTLDLSKFALGNEYLMISPNRIHTIDSASYVSLSRMNRVLAREDEKDIIDCDFNIQYIDGRGGKNSVEQDIISIGYDECSSDYKYSGNCGSYSHINGVQIIVRPYTTIHNYVSEGKFKYFVNQKKGKASINLESSGKHSFLLKIHYKILLL